TSVTVWGTTHLAKIDNGTRYDPGWECFVDNISIGATDPFEFPENNWVLCQQSTLNDGPHEVTVNVTTTGTTFWLDYITYTPSASALYQESVLRVENSDTALLYGAGWGSLGGTANQTTAKGAQAKYDFVGTSVTWVGFIPTEYPHNAATGSYSIDGSAAVSFNLNGLSATATTTVYNQAFFTTPDLTAGPHSLLVTYNGGAGASTPLTLDYLLVTNTSLPSTAGATTVAPSSPTSPAASSGGNVSQRPETASDSATPVGAIVGGVVGGLAFIAILLLIVWWCRRNRATRIRPSPGYLGTGTNASSSVQPRNAQLHSFPSNPSMQQLQPEPFILPHANPEFRSPSQSDVSFSGSSSAPRSTYPNSPHAQGRSAHTPTHTHATSFDASESSGYALGAIESGYALAGGDHLQPVRKGQNMPPPPTVTAVVHQDSGVRLNHHRPNVIVEDVPPTYSAN
ncbi:hypothetical protein H0H87_006981, partial [Tephrocybe sp. NHM501043]